MTDYDNSNYPQRPTYRYDDSYNYQPEPKKPKKKKGNGGIVAMVCVVALACTIGGSLITGYAVIPSVVNNAIKQYNVANPVTETKQTAPLNTDKNTKSALEQTAYNPVVGVAEESSESVVGVLTYQREFVSGQEPNLSPISSGTGFAIDENGHILTNNHVVAEGNAYKIVTEDGTEYEASLVGTDVDTEIAVLKVNGANLKPIKIGDSDALKTGELVVAIGNPLGQQLANSITVGYVSSVSRDMSLGDSRMGMIQTDAAINPGNSGGPLVNSNGEVIGINTMKNIYAGIDSNTGGVISAEGIGFAVPINVGMDIAGKLIENGAIVKPGIGIRYGLISEEDAKLWEVPRGALIGEVTPNGPASKAGIKLDDVITEIDGVDLTKGAEMPPIKDKNIGDVVKGKVYRGGTYYSFEMVIEDLNQLNKQGELEPVAPSLFG